MDSVPGILALVFPGVAATAAIAGAVAGFLALRNRRQKPEVLRRNPGDIEIEAPRIAELLSSLEAVQREVREPSLATAQLLQQLNHILAIRPGANPEEALRSRTQIVTENLDVWWKYLRSSRGSLSQEDLASEWKKHTEWEGGDRSAWSRLETGRMRRPPNLSAYYHLPRTFGFALRGPKKNLLATLRNGLDKARLVLDFRKILEASEYIFQTADARGPPGLNNLVREPSLPSHNSPGHTMLLHAA